MTTATIPGRSLISPSWTFVTHDLAHNTGLVCQCLIRSQPSVRLLRLDRMEEDGKPIPSFFFPDKQSTSTMGKALQQILRDSDPPGGCRWRQQAPKSPVAPDAVGSAEETPSDSSLVTAVSEMVASSNASVQSGGPLVGATNVAESRGDSSAGETLFQSSCSLKCRHCSPLTGCLPSSLPSLNWYLSLLPAREFA